MLKNKIADIIAILTLRLNHCITHMIEKSSNFPLLSPLYVIIDWRERDMDRINLCGLGCEACLLHFNEIKGGSDRI